MQTTVSLNAPYLIFLGDVGDDGHAKTGFGIPESSPQEFMLSLYGFNVTPH